ncbi:hypothetical protein BaRGS_00023033 [Batillaria attramentaria]|uniref:Uncharacterized protein n=1 Tax=Batillaria attramentaria TaxID=370345 RepID=A0ABD0KFE1_9CAEN
MGALSSELYERICDWRGFRNWPFIDVPFGNRKPAAIPFRLVASHDAACWLRSEICRSLCSWIGRIDMPGMGCPLRIVTTQHREVITGSDHRAYIAVEFSFQWKRGAIDPRLAWRPNKLPEVSGILQRLKPCCAKTSQLNPSIA